MLGELFRLAFEIGPRLDEGLDDFVKDEIRGAILEFDSYWMETSSWEWVRSPWGYYPIFDREHARLRHRLLDHEDIEQKLGWRPPRWDDYCKKIGYPAGSSPIVIRLILREPAARSSGRQEFPNQFDGYPIVYEYRPRCRAISTGIFSDFFGRLRRGPDNTHAPISIGRANPNTAGTLGGLLRGVQTGGHYLVSCAHVLGGVGATTFTPGPYEGHHSRQIAVVEYSEIPPLKKPSQRCNPRSSAHATHLDAAVAKIDGGMDDLRALGEIPTIARLRLIDEMQQNDDVWFVGKVSRRVDAQLEGVVMWFEIEYEDGPRCFGGGFSLKPKAPRYVYQRIAKPGDSGSWVVAQQGDSICWAGMLIGADDSHAYGCFAETILSACKAQIPGGLMLA
jgi:hypothetical protein